VSLVVVEKLAKGVTNRMGSVAYSVANAWGKAVGGDRGR